MAKIKLDKSTGMHLQELMSTQPEELAEKQHKHLKDHVIGTLKKAVMLIEDENYSEIDNMLFHSPAGDGYGFDNDCIDFRISGVSEPMDIGEVTDWLKKLKDKSK